MTTAQLWLYACSSSIGLGADVNVAAQFLGLAECAETMMRLPVFYKQKFALFFPSWAYAIPFAIIRLPITFIEVSAWSLVVYFAVGFEASVDRCAVQQLAPLPAHMYPCGPTSSGPHTQTHDFESNIFNALH